MWPGLANSRDTLIDIVVKLPVDYVETHHAVETVQKYPNTIYSNTKKAFDAKEIVDKGNEKRGINILETLFS